jgi:hypothetical protein
VGRFSIDRVAPGSYFLVAKAGAGGLEITAIQRIEIRPVLIAPTNGPPVYLSLGPPQSIAGRIVTEVRQAADLRASFIALQSVDPELPSPSPVFIRPDGLFTVNGIMPGTYVLDMSNLPQDLYVKAARYGEDDILEQPLTLVTRDAPKAIQIALGSDGGHLQVAAYSAKNEVHPGAQFVLVPDTARRRRRDQYRVATAGADGQAMFQGIPPGKYKLFAWEHLEPNAYLNAEYLALYEDSGLPVTIVPGDNRSTAVRTIPR